MMSKECFIAAHEELIEEYMSRWCDTHPDATTAEYRAAAAHAYDKTADAAYNRFSDKLADMADAARVHTKYARV
jgi:hypothetical protein